ncbi:hypothetical protein F4808DRAFT_48065 [Astrocystis sublimbata]|nr:hypothetical protein F4808DRAFT_48065 [Astrocystis sublimbata]
MSVFSILKRGRAQAKEHSAKQAGKDKGQPEAVKAPYKHVPTHAAIDALATAPSSWRGDDRSKIREQNRHRSARAASSYGHSRSNSALPRVGSNLTNVSYPSVYANPVVPLPHNYSYSSIPSLWRERMANTPGASDEADYFSHHRDPKGKGKDTRPFVIGTGGTASPVISSGRTSPLSSRVAPVIARPSAAVNGGLEVPSDYEDETNVNRQSISSSSKSNNSHSRPPLSHENPTNSERLHRLHPAHARRMSESRATPTSSDRHYPPPAKSTYYSFSAPRPTSRRAHSMDRPVSSAPGLPGQVYGHAPSSSSASSVASIGMAISTAPTTADSTPPPSAAGAKPPATRTRRNSLGDYLRRSTDTPRMYPNEPRDMSQSQAPQTRGRRLSKSKPGQQGEADGSASASDSPVGGTPLVKPTQSQTEAMVYELDRIESRTRYGSDDAYAHPKLKHAKGRLSKDRPLSRAQIDNNTPNGTKPRWSFFGRRNSIAGD